MMEEQDNKNRVWTILILAVLVVGVFAFIKGWKRAHENSYYAYYNDIKGLQASSPVVMQGATVGKIADIELNGNHKVKVTINIHKQYKIPEGTVALLSSGGLTGEKVIQLASGTGPGILPDGGILPTAFDTTAVSSGTTQTRPLEMIKGALHFTDSTLVVLNELMKRGLMVRVTNTVIYMENETKSYSVLAGTLNDNSEKMVNAIQNMHNSVEDVNSSNGHLAESIKSARDNTSKLARSGIGDNIRNIQAGIDTLNINLAGIRKHDLLNKNKAYKDAADNAGKLAKSLDETKERPKGFSIFGKK